MINEEKLKKNLRHYASIAFERGFVWGKSGNISAKVDEDSFIISASGASLGDLHDEDIVHCSIFKNIKYGSKKPSIESKMHGAVYRTRTDINAVLHSQPFFTTLLACSNIPIDTNLFPEAMFYLGKIDRVTYHHPGSNELAEEVYLKAKNADIIILDNHGAVCSAKSLEEIILKTETLEFLSKLLIYAEIGDIPLKFLNGKVAEDLSKHLRTIRKI